MAQNYDLKVITYYCQDDGESKQSALGGDYAWIEIRDKRGELITWYGDDYHDKGYDKMKGFIDGMTILYERSPIVKYENKVTKEYSPNSDEESLLGRLEKHE